MFADRVGDGDTELDEVPHARVHAFTHIRMHAHTHARMWWCRCEVLALRKQFGVHGDILGAFDRNEDQAPPLNNPLKLQSITKMLQSLKSRGSLVQYVQRGWQLP